MTDISELKRIGIRGYLARRGVLPKRERGRYGMYLSPLRDEKAASFKVDYDRNLWFDFGSGEGGSIIDLVMNMEGCGFAEAVEKLKRYDSGSFASGQVDVKKEGFGLETVKEKGGFIFDALKVQDGVGLETVKEKGNIAEVESKEKEGLGLNVELTVKEKGIFHTPTIEITDVMPLANVLLINYLKERCIRIDVARKYCSEVYYRIDEREYFAIGFENDSGGYELRNRFFKGCSSKDITTIVTDSIVTESIVTESIVTEGIVTDNRSCCVFEGFIDFLSYLVLNDLSVCNEDVVVLNTAYNLQKAMPFISSHDRVKSFFDNDAKGREISSFLYLSCENVISQSDIYEGYKDLNEFLINRY